MSKSTDIHKPQDMSESETRKGPRSWAISLKPRYVMAIRLGIKTYEVRTKVPRGLCRGDRLFVVQSASGGEVVLCITVGGVFKISPREIWNLFCYALGISKEEYDKYTRGRRQVFLIKFGKIEEMPEGTTFRDLGLQKAPQWFCRIR